MKKTTRLEDVANETSAHRPRIPSLGYLLLFLYLGCVASSALSEKSLHVRRAPFVEGTQAIVAGCVLGIGAAGSLALFIKRSQEYASRIPLLRNAFWLYYCLTLAIPFLFRGLSLDGRLSRIAMLLAWAATLCFGYYYHSRLQGVAKTLSKDLAPPQ